MGSIANALEPEEISIEKCAGRVLAEPLIAPFALPRFDNSAVDGYAVGSGAQEFRVVGAISAGDAPTRALDQDSAVRIFTGAQVPVHAFSVVMQEDVVRSNDCIRLAEIPAPGQHIRRAGEEVAAGQEVLPKGTALNPAGAALLASFGFEKISVHRLPRVAIVITGAELIKCGPLGDGAIYESNSYGLLAALRSVRIVPNHISLVQDSLEETRASLTTALEIADVVITTGGVSVGDKDVVRAALHQLGVSEVFWKVAIKPGKPIYFGRLGSKYVFGLPGNPLSVLATYTLFVEPFIKALCGYPFAEPLRLPGVVAETIHHKPGRMELVPAVHRTSDSKLVVEAISGQGSHMLSGMARATGWIEVPKDSERISQGAVVRFYPIGDESK